MSCPLPLADGISVQDREIGLQIYGIGKLSWDEERQRWVCLADVEGRLCLVEVKVYEPD